MTRIPLTFPIYIGDCASGFGPVIDPIFYIPQGQVIIPSLQFNDSGHITAFHLAGICSGDAGEPGVPVADYLRTVQGCISILQVWRPSGDRFSIAAIFTATLSVTYATPVTASATVDEPIPFSSGDVLGFTPGPSPGFFFQIASTSTAGNTHIYYTYESYSPELMTVGNDGVSTSPIISVEGTCAHATVDLVINVICVPHSMMLHFVLQLAVWRCPPFSHLVMLLALVLDQVLA